MAIRADERDWLAEAEHIATGSMLRPELGHIVALYERHALMVRSLRELARQCDQKDRDLWQLTKGRAS